MTVNIFFILSLIFTTSLFDTINQLLLKTSINALDLHINSIKKLVSFIVKLVMIPKVWLGFICACVSLVIWLYVLSKADLNFAFSADSMHYIMIALTAKFFLKEKVGLKRWLGTVFIVIGIVLLTVSNK